METLKKIWSSFKNIFGFTHNSKYVKKYLDDSNMRYSIYMSIVIILLELYLVFRQTFKYVIPDIQAGKNFFDTVFKYTSSYWLLMGLGFTMLFYALFYVSKKKHTKGLFITTNVFSGLTIIQVVLFPFNKPTFTDYVNTTSSILLIVFYSSICLFSLATIGSSIYRYRGGKGRVLNYILVISLFGLCCLIFGTRISFVDFTHPTKPTKMLICFLMMAIYIGCLLIWKPYISLGILGTFFLGLYILIINVEKNGGRHFEEGDAINYLTFFIALVMITFAMFNQRVKEAKNDEELEVLATEDKLTGLYSFDYFVTLAKRKIEAENLKVNKWVYLFIDITNFKVFNDQRGFQEGNRFLFEVGKVIADVFKEDLVSRQSDDHFVVFAKNTQIEEKLEMINQRVEKLDLDIRPGVKTGKYLLRDLDEDPHEAIEKARYARELLDEHPGRSSLFYDKEIHDHYRVIQYIARHVDEAIEKGEISVKYQPIVLSKDNQLCGVEALARWHDPKYGDFAPSIFIEALENAQLVYKIDLAILRYACGDLRYNIANKMPAIPVSINISRLDFELLDIVSMIDEIVQEYCVPKELITIELTESALMEDEDILKSAIKRLHDLGYKVWLDDFGAGYSSFNVLKDYDFDLMKLDMKFLKGFETNQKAKALIRAVVAMAKEIGIHTLCEGVESDEASRFLKSVGCERMQGYLFGKPFTYEEMKDKIVNGQYILSSEIKRK